MSDQEELVKAIGVLRREREIAYHQNVHRDDLQRRLSATTEWGILQLAEVELKRLDTAVKDAETQVRKLALEVYGATGEKRPAAGVQIKLLTRLVYDVKAVTAWARVHLPDVLKLDVKPFERIVKAGLPDAPVEIVVDAVAYIDAELPE